MKNLVVFVLVASFFGAVLPARADDRAALARYQMTLTQDPSNTFYQYAVERTARRLGVEPGFSGSRGRWRDRWRTQLYETTTGLASIQESLQLDRLAGGGDVLEPPTIPIASIAALPTPSMPFEKMRNNRTPGIEPLAKLAPADWYYAHFPRVSSMRRVLDASDRWGGHLLSAYTINGRDNRVREKIERALLLQSSPQLDPVYELAVGDLAVVGSDPFLFEGSDVTVIFTVKNELLVATNLEMQRRNAASGGAERVSIVHEEYRGWTIDGLQTGDRAISSFAAIGGGAAVVSTSLGALKSVIDVAAGAAPSLAASEDFQYYRAVRPYEEILEDGFLFLSDAFVRRVVGPRLKIGEARRVRCAVTLQMISYARVLFETEQHRAPVSIPELIGSKYLDREDLRCPDGGEYSLDGGVPVCSVHNRLRALTPNIELRVDMVTQEEADAYHRFIDSYHSYWRRFIDPVGIRVRATDRLELDAMVLPLVENSIYSSFLDATGPEPVSLARPQLPTAIATVDVKLPAFDLKGERQDRWVGAYLGTDDRKLFGRALGNHASIQIGDGRPRVTTNTIGLFAQGPPFGLEEWVLLAPLGTSLSLPLAVEVPVKDKAALDECLADIRAYLAAQRMREEEWFSVDQYQAVQGGSRTVDVVSVRLFIFEWRLYYAVAGDRFILATERDFIDQLATGEPVGPGEGNLRLELIPSRWKEVAPSMALSYAEQARRTCLANLSWLEALYNAFPKVQPYDSAAQSLPLFGTTFVCPDGGRYIGRPGGQVECTQHGSRLASRQGPRPQPGSPAAYMIDSVRRIEATLSFLPDGISTTVRIE